jgi:3-oxoadipyl-CoA thiolase
MSTAAYLIDGVRTPIGRHGGSLAEVRADDMAAHIIARLVDRTGVPPERIDDVILGCANQAGEDNRNVARMAALLAGLPVGVPGVTVNRLCGSGMQAVADAARQILAGEAHVIIAGGVEQMTRAPLVMPKPGEAYARGNHTVYDTTLGWRMVNPRMEKLHETLPLGITAERVAARENVSREQQDRFAHESQQKAARALQSGRFEREIAPVVTGKNRKTGESIVFAVDEHPRADATFDRLAKLPPVFDTAGTVTAGNSSGINDGAAAILLASEAAVRELGLTPMARYVSWGVAGVEPSYMGLGPIPASRKALARAGLSARQIDLSEVNEAFAAQAIPCIRALDLDPATVNVNGGAIALGHPLGASGARMILTLMHELVERKLTHGMATMCIGVGQGITAILERVTSQRAQG